jgi:hypothetical protein
MILDQTIGSARAEKQDNPSARHVVRYLLTAMLASALAMPSLAVWGNDSPPTAVATKPIELPLPPIPYLDSIPWMKWNAAAPMMKIEHADGAEHHSVGHPANASGSSSGETDIQLTTFWFSAVREAIRDPHCAA